MSVDWRKLKGRRKSKEGVSSVPKPALKFDDFSKRLTGPRKAAILMVMVISAERHRLKSAKEKV